MKELSIEEKAKAYDEALDKARKLYNSEETSADVEIACENIFPELIESEDEDERIRKEIIEFLQLPHPQFLGKRNHEEWINWLEKRVPINEEKVWLCARKNVATSIINFLDCNMLDDCLSTMECGDLEDAVVNLDWSKVYDYMKKKLEKQGEQKSGNINVNKMVMEYSQTKDGDFGLPVNRMIRAYRQGINDVLNKE